MVIKAITYNVIWMQFFIFFKKSWKNKAKKFVSASRALCRAHSVLYSIFFLEIWTPNLILSKQSTFNCSMFESLELQIIQTPQILGYSIAKIYPNSVRYAQNCIAGMHQRLYQG